MLLAATVVLGVGCDKNKPYDLITPVPAVHFDGAATQTYSVLVNPTPAFAVNVGTTDVSSADRTVGYTITSSTGAVVGNQYTVSGTAGTVTIPAGQSVATFNIQANYDSYTSGRIDTLLVTLNEPSVTVADFQNTLTVILRGPCFEGDVDPAAFVGSYENTNEDFGGSAYGPYTTTVSNPVLTSPTTATIKITNIWDNGWGPITFVMDWTDPANRTLTVVQQTSGIADASTIGAAYAGNQVAVRPFVGETGTFSACDGTLTVKMQLGVNPLGWFSDLYEVDLVR